MGSPEVEREQDPGIHPLPRTDFTPGPPSLRSPSTGPGPPKPNLSNLSNLSCPPSALTALQAFRSQAEQEKRHGEGPGAHDAEWDRMAPTLQAFKHPCWVGSRPGPPAVRGRGSAGRTQGASPHLSLWHDSNPSTSPRPTPHPSWVLTAGTGPHLAPGAPPPVRVGAPAPDLGGSDSLPAAGKGQAGTPGPAHRELERGGKARPRNVGEGGRQAGETLMSYCDTQRAGRGRGGRDQSVPEACGNANSTVDDNRPRVHGKSLSSPGGSGTIPGGGPWSPNRGCTYKSGPGLPPTGGGDTQGACPGILTVP